ncbi:bifunctional phosphatase PAP2/diacylglycerol kinase family protein [Actinomadura scrupuli]|uniref:bifunctional phosphatase PAP2/diacylglycerol kinase family protein n=1 Tax=Actinomadura scrupuli TaxID=559629 RepID=UPI003D98D7B8
MATGLASTRQTRLRRAALRGVIGIGIASPIVNVVGKQAFRRKRPIIDLVPHIRVRWRIPTSPAFPSGHSASAAAFATGVAMEAPAAVAVPVGVVAGMVAFSRVYNGAHYPGDVLAGVGLGILAGLVTRTIWTTHAGPARIARVRSVEAWRAAQDGDTTELDQGDGLVAVINSAAGSSSPRLQGLMPGIADQLRAELPRAEVVEFGPDDDLDKLLDEAAGRARVLAVAGGDGTVNAGAQAAMRYGVPLLTIPAGTLDHFSRALGIDTVTEALAVFREGAVAKVDVGRIETPDEEDHIFLNTASFGAYTELVDQRERLQARLGKWPALAVAAVRVMRHTQPVETLVNGDRRYVWLAFVGNCAYSSRGATPIWRDRLDDGELDIRVIATGRHGRRLRAITAVLAGHLHVTPEYSHWQATRLSVEAVAPEPPRNGRLRRLGAVPAGRTSGQGGRAHRPGRPRRPPLHNLLGPARRRTETAPELRLARDGETFSVTTAAKFTKEPGGLAVFVPRPK